MNPSSLQYPTHVSGPVDLNAWRTRRGLIELDRGASHPVRCPDGKTRHLVSRAMPLVIEAARRENRELTVKVVNLSSQKFYDSYEAMLAAVAAESAIGGAIVWAYFSSDALDPDAAKKVAALRATIAGREKVITKLRGSLSNAEDIDALDVAQQKIKAQMKLAEDEQRECFALQESIIGLMSAGEPIKWNPRPPEAA